MKKPLPSQRRLYTPIEVQEIFNISRPTFGDWCRKGVLDKIVIPGRRRVYVTAECVERLIAGKKR